MDDTILATGNGLQKKITQCSTALNFIAEAGDSNTLADVTTLVTSLGTTLEGITDDGIQNACLNFQTALVTAVTTVKTSLESAYAAL